MFDIPSSHADCIVCGSNNPNSLKLRFVRSGEGVRTFFRASRILQGYEGLVHGGVISTLLDAAMTHCLFSQGIEAVTADLQIRFLEPVQSSDHLEICARKVSGRGRLHVLEAEMFREGQLLVRANGKFLQRRANA